MVVLLLVLTGCSTSQTPSNSNQPSQPAAANQPSQPSSTATPHLREGEASGTIVDEGQSITLKYAYAGHGEQFNEPAIVILLTETPIAPALPQSPRLIAWLLRFVHLLVWAASFFGSSPRCSRNQAAAAFELISNASLMYISK